MNKSKLRDIIKELSSKLLKDKNLSEVGEASAQSYAYKIKYKSYFRVDYTFTTDSDLDYIVIFNLDNHIADVGFYIEQFKRSSLQTGSGLYLHTSNKGELFKVMATVTNIIKDFLQKNPEIEHLVISPTKENDDDNRRTKLYIAFIKKNIPNIQFTFKQKDNDLIISRNSIEQLIKEIIEKQKRDRCLRIADRKFDKPSAYKSGAVVRCRKGDIWKDLKEDQINELDISKYISSWIDTKTLKKQKNFPEAIFLHLKKEGYINKGEIYRVLTLDPLVVMIKQNTEYIDLDKFLEDNKNIKPYSDLYSTYQDEKEVVARLDKNFSFEDIHYASPSGMNMNIFLKNLDKNKLKNDILKKDQGKLLSFTKNRDAANDIFYTSINFLEDDEDLDETKVKEAFDPQSGKAAPYGSGYSKIKDIIREIIQEESINKKIDELPQGKIFSDSKNIESIFRRSSHNWSEVIELFEKNKNKSKPDTIDIKDIHITQPNIQANKVKNMLDKVNDLSPINVVEFEDGEKVIYDGHHRLVANWALGNNRIKVNLVKVNNLQEDESLHKWFKRSGTPGKEGGWIDCNAPIRKDGKITGYKPCGRKEGEKRSKYPSCRPTAAKCKDKGKGTKWGKTK